MADQLRNLTIDFNQAVAEFHRVGSSETNTVNAFDRGNVGDQLCQIHLTAIVHGAPVGVDVLAQQIDFAHALGRQVYHFGDHIIERAADFLAPGVGHHAEGAVFTTAFHDGDK